MRMILVLAASLLMVQHAAADKIPPDLADRYALFEGMVDDAAKRMNIVTPPVVAVDMMQGGDAPARTFFIPSFFGGSVGYVIHIKFATLREMEEIGLTHVAEHEVCHVLLQHPGKPLDEYRKEFEAERCVYRNLGGETYLKFMRYQGKLNPAKHGMFNVGPDQDLLDTFKAYFEKKE
jgi:hypothetical protein